MYDAALANSLIKESLTISLHSQEQILSPYMNNNPNTPSMIAVAANIRRKRESQNLTQEYVAFRLSISQNAFSKIELGYTRITVDRLLQIADILGCTPMELIKIH